MGAESFITSSMGKTADIAFHSAVEEALYECGHGGYTGTIAEKDSYVEIPLPKCTDGFEEANRLVEIDDPRISDKWGPAGCFNLGKGRYLFFGWASS
jgi:hypothetical protein